MKVGLLEVILWQVTEKVHSLDQHPLGLRWLANFRFVLAQFLHS